MQNCIQHMNFRDHLASYADRPGPTWLHHALLLFMACSSITDPGCEREKRAVYAATIGGELPPTWLFSNVWRLDPVTTIYFNNDCSVTRVAP